MFLDAENASGPNLKRDERMRTGTCRLDNRDTDDNVVMGDESYWDEVDKIDLEGFINGLTSDNGSMMSAADKHAKHCDAIIIIVSVSSLAR